MKTILTSAVCLALLSGGQAFAQEKKTEKGKPPERIQKVLLDSDTFRAAETVYPPGSVSTIHPGLRATRVIKGGTLIRTYSDGRKEAVIFKDGEVTESQAAPAPYTVTNPGKSDVILYTVTLKSKK